MYREIFIFAILYYAVALLYRVILLKDQEQKRVFESIAVYCKDFTDSVPMTFVMGFFVAMVVTRWWQMYMAIPWVDRCAVHIAAFIQGMDERGRLIRRSLVRYLNLIWVLTFQAVSTVIKKRFPTRDHLVEGGLMTVEEKMALEEISSVHGDWFIPSSWFTNLAMEARKEGRIHDDLHLKSIVDEMLQFRGGCGMAYSFDWISIPLVYTQVVTIVVYSFFAACLMGRQYLFIEESSDHESLSYSNIVDKYVPVFTLFQFFFYFGWLKVAEVMICPFGEDDDDFELNWILDRNVQVGLMLVDDFYRKHPKLVQDQFWNDVEPEIPYTEAASAFKTDPYLGSTVSMNINAKGMEWQVPEAIVEEVDPFSPRKKASQDYEGDAESGSGNPHPATQSPTFRPKFLNRLLAGDSRLSLVASRFGSKNSIISGKTPRSPLQSPRSVPRRQRSAPIGNAHNAAMKGRRPSNHRFQRQSETSETIHMASEALDFRPISVFGHNQQSDSRLSSLITLEDGDTMFRNQSIDWGLGNGNGPNSPADKGATSPLAVDGDLSLGNKETPQSPLHLEEHEIAWPKDTVTSPGAGGSGGGTGEPGTGFLEQVNVPPPLKEVPEPETEVPDSTVTRSPFASSPKAFTGPSNGTSEETKALISTETVGGEESNGTLDDSSEDSDENQKTITSVTQLMPKKTDN